MSSANEKLVDAAGRGDVAEIERQLAAGADPNAFEGTNKWTPLQRAARFGHVVAIAALLKAGARVDGANSIGWTPLTYAAGKGHTAAVDALVAAGADVHRADNCGRTALHVASSNGNLGAARVLLEAGAKTDVRDSSGHWLVDVVRAPSRSLVAAVRLHRAAVPPRCHAQVCWFADKSNAAALRALFAAAAPWSRRRPVAIACYAVGWEWEQEA
jgi:ankyrin repeat protein